MFLDANIVYSSGVFETPQGALERAQVRKFELICRKLGLKQNDRVLEIGTGRGGFAAYAATTRGCRIWNTTIGKERFRSAQEWFNRLGEAGKRIKLVLEDYRNLHDEVDKVVSIEMFEAVGLGNYDTYFAACDRVLRPGGRCCRRSHLTNNAFRLINEVVIRFKSTFSRERSWRRWRDYPVVA